MKNINPNELDTHILGIHKDTESLRMIYNSFHKELFAYAYSILKDSYLAEDAVSETMLRLYTKASEYKGYGKGRMYIFSICKRVCFEIRKESYKDIPDENMYEKAGSYNYEINTDSIFLREVLDALNVKQRQVIVLHYYHGFTFKEISELINCPEGTVKWRHTQALKKCRIKESEV